MDSEQYDRLQEIIDRVGAVEPLYYIAEYIPQDRMEEFLNDFERDYGMAKSFNSMINKVKKGWQPTIDYTTGEQIFRPGYDDEAGSFDNTSEPEQRYKTEDREPRSIQLGDITVNYDFVTTYDEMDGYVISTYSFITSMETPLGTTEDIHSSSGYSSHIFDYDNDYSIRVSVRQQEGTFDEWYGVRYSFFKKDTPLYMVGNNGYSIEASSYDELLSLIERRDELLKSTEYTFSEASFIDDIDDALEYDKGWDKYERDGVIRYMYYGGFGTIELYINLDDVCYGGSGHYELDVELHKGEDEHREGEFRTVDDLMLVVYGTISKYNNGHDYRHWDGDY